MMAEEHDDKAASDAREATEIYPFASGYPQQTGTARGPLPDWQAADQPLGHHQADSRNEQRVLADNVGDGAIG